MQNPYYLILLPLLMVLVACVNTGNVTKVSIGSSTDIVGADKKLTESIGIEVIGGVFATLLEQGEEVPCYRTQVYSTGADKQTQVTLNLYKGNCELVKNCDFLGKYQISGFKEADRGKPIIQMVFGVDKDYIFISASDLVDNAKLKISKLDSQTK
jgi:molecular chaperone DnaK